MILIAAQQSFISNNYWTVSQNDIIHYVYVFYLHFIVSRHLSEIPVRMQESPRTSILFVVPKN